MKTFVADHGWMCRIERAKAGMKKRYLIFCCTPYCLHREMRAFLNNHEKVTIRHAGRIIIDGNSEHWFIQDGNKNKEKFYGMLLTDYRTCGNYTLDDTLASILESHKGRME